MSLFHGYVGARSCTGGPQPGNIALRDWARETYGARNDGIYNCRPVRGSSTTTSLHGEGRATDIGCDAGDAWAAVLADLLRTNSAELGVQCVIYNRRIWSGAYPDAGWRDYHGVDAHTTHLHVELCWDAARTLTVEHIKAVIAHTAAPTGTVHAVASKARVVQWQALLEFAPSRRDGIWGPDTDRRSQWLRTAARFAAGTLAGSARSTIRLVQRVVDTPDDGVWGPESRGAMHAWTRQAQRFLGVDDDGDWGPVTERAYQAFRRANHH